LAVRHAEYILLNHPRINTN